jgi:hypothetical protein
MEAQYGVTLNEDNLVLRDGKGTITSLLPFLYHGPFLWCGMVPNPSKSIKLSLKEG